ncbi:hypothetical protein [Pararhizobium arenae]|uniref:hypothetical protein n=1 Tax=Pararhizobium arenae TaxID=1856850 RepID=UPI00094B10B3|nr:hypothetical protein [Pararhizobium arenae]
MPAAASRIGPDHHDRDQKFQESIEPAMQQLIAAANAAGWGTGEILDEMGEVLFNLRLAYAEDPDAEEDPS